MHAVIVIEATEPGEQFLRRPIRLAIAIEIFEHQDVRRLTDIDLARSRFAARDRRDGDADRRDQVLPLVKDRHLVRFADALRVFEDNDAITLGPEDGALEHDAPIVDRFANPDPAQMVHIDAGRVDQIRLVSEELDLQIRRDLHRAERVFRRHLGEADRRHDGHHNGNQKVARHGSRRSGGE